MAMPPVSGSKSQFSASQNSGYVDSIQDAAIRRLLQSFPLSELEARSVGSTTFADTIFGTEKRDGVTYVTVPKNAETHSGSLLFISILKIFEINQWIPTLSTKDVPKAVFETNDGGFFAGFVAASLDNSTGAHITGKSKYSKGQEAFQIYSVDMAYPGSKHLRTGGMQKIIKNLNDMKSFTKEWWSTRSTITALFKGLRPAAVSHLETFFKSREEINKNIANTFKFKNGGIFRGEEITYLSQRYSEEIRLNDEFQALLLHPTPDLATNFNTRYQAVKTALDRVNEEVRLVVANRSRIAFPSSQKKEDKKFAAKNLTEKLSIMSEASLTYWFPETLPGVSAAVVEGDLIRGSPEFLRLRYETAMDQPTTREIIESWYVALSNL